MLLIVLGCTRTPAVVAEKNSTEQAASEQSVKKQRDLSAVESITFADLDLPMEPDSLFQMWMLTQRVHDLTGRSVRISGFMGNGLFQLRNIREFVLMRDLECCQFGPGGTADHLIQIKLQNGLTTAFTTNLLTVEGKLSIAPFTGSDGKTWAVYQIDAVKINKGE